MEKTVLAGRGGDGVVMRRKKEVKRRKRKLSLWRGKHPPKTLTYLGLGTTSNKNTHTHSYGKEKRRGKREEIRTRRARRERKEEKEKGEKKRVGELISFYVHTPLIFDRVVKVSVPCIHI